MNRPKYTEQEMQLDMVRGAATPDEKGYLFAFAEEIEMLLARTESVHAELRGHNLRLFGSDIAADGSSKGIEKTPTGACEDVYSRLRQLGSMLSQVQDEAQRLRSL